MDTKRSFDPVRKMGGVVPPPAYRPLPQMAQLKPSAAPVPYRPVVQSKIAAAPPVYRPVPQTPQMKPASWQGASVRPTPPPVYRPSVQTPQLKAVGVPMTGPPAYRPLPVSPLPAPRQRMAFSPLLRGTVQRASHSSTEVKKPAEDGFEAVGAKAKKKAAAKETKDQELAQTILQDANTKYASWLSEAKARDLNCGTYIVNKAVCQEVEAAAPAEGFTVQPMREKDAKSAVNLLAWSEGYQFNYHVFWSKTA